MKTVVSIVVLMMAGLFCPGWTFADGNVEVFVTNTKMTITGDEKSNKIKITTLDFALFEIVSLDNTTINNRISPLRVRGVNSIEIHTKRGDDVVEMYHDDLTFFGMPGDLVISTGEGNDQLNLHRFWLYGDAQIQMDDGGSSPQGEDQFVCHQLKVNGFLYLSTGGGADQISFNTDGGFNNPNTALQGALIDTGWGRGGKDYVFMDSFFTWASLYIYTGKARDRLYLNLVQAYNGVVSIKTHEGDDQLVYTDTNMNWSGTSYPTAIELDLGNGNNNMYMQNLAINGSINLETGSGNDVLTFDEVFVGQRLFVDTNKGDDGLYLASCDAQQLTLDGGSHKAGDLLMMIDVQFSALFKTGWETIFD